MADRLQAVRELKVRAKNERDFEDYEQALRTLDEAIRLLDSSEAQITEPRSRLDSELADCWGMKGGVQRRWARSSSGERAEHLRQAILAYDEGYKHEGESNSYNMVNRLLTRVMAGAGAGVEMDPTIPRLDLQSELEKVEGRIRPQLASHRRGDYWALADLALVDLLLERSDAESAYAGYFAQSPPAFAHQSVLSVLEELIESPYVHNTEIAKAVQLLREQLRQLQPA
jgi:hypothetical protein